jgi:hypothetical protein
MILCNNHHHHGKLWLEDDLPENVSTHPLTSPLQIIEA